MLLGNRKIDPQKDPLGLLADAIEEQFAGLNTPDFIPTGVQEDYIVPFGCGKFSIILILDNNKAGKTTTAVNILRHLFWGQQNSPYFDGWWNAEGNEFSTGKNTFANWPYSTKSGRVTGTVKNTSEGGPIDKEIRKWWPKTRFTREKQGKNFYCFFRTDTDFEFDVLTYEQSPAEYEGPFLSWTWSDEPPPAKLIGPITTRFAGGGIWLVTATPISCGAFLDTIYDLRDNGKSIYITNHSIYESDYNTGKENHLNTKRGLWTREQIDDYVAGIPIDERPSRVFGQADSKSGKIYADFEPNVHILGAPDCPHPMFTIDSNFARMCNHFCVMDPHRKAYPAIQWWMLSPGNDFICYNEWPDYSLLGAYYDEVRSTTICKYTPEQIARFIKIFDGSRVGLKILARFMDPRFGKATEGEFGRGTESLMSEYTKYGVLPAFELPPQEFIDLQRDRIRDLLRYDKSLPVNQYNRPKIYWMPHCRNSIRAIQRHHWADPKPGQLSEKEDEMFKDFIDPLRYLLAGLGDRGYITASKKRISTINQQRQDRFSLLHDTALA